MAAGLPLDQVAKAYEEMSNEELKRIALNEANDLTPQAVELIKKEIRKRRLDNNISDAVDVQRKELTLREVDSFCDLISGLPCPTCGSLEKLNGTVTAEVMSFLLFTNYSKKLKIACPSCLDSANNKALATTVLLGWWGIPWGIIRSVQSITLNTKNKKTNHAMEHNDFLRAFAISNIGILESYKHDKEQLEQLLVRQNSQ